MDHPTRQSGWTDGHLKRNLVVNNLTLTYRSPGQIKPRHKQWRPHTPEQIGLIEKSLREHGCVEPVLIDSEDRVVCGQAVVIAAQNIGLNSIPVICVDHLSDEQLRAYAIKANRIADIAGYDEALLALELNEINELLGGDLDFADFGFEPAELDRILGLTDIERDELLDVVPDILPEQAVSKPGDLWLIGDHRLYCGDALINDSYVILLDGQLAQLVLSDLPYNLPAKTISGNGKFQHRDFLQAAGELSPDQFTRWLTKGLRLMRAHSVDGSLHMLFMGRQFLLELLRAGKIVYDDLKDIVTWVKKSGGQGPLYRSQTEFIVIYKSGKGKYINNVKLGKYGRNRTNAWFYDGMNTPSAERDELLASHPTCKPVELLADAILDTSTKGSIVLDPFAGSGSLILAAHKVQRRAYAMELDPLYVDVSLRRIYNTLGIDAVRASDGASFADLDAQAREKSDSNKTAMESAV
ncbi:MAG: DNA methylase N-4 [Sphingopyxis sp.]|nr:DNA methylase N-4 [Sphingopyxis sp.]